MTESSDTPVTKVGAVIVRDVDTNPQFLLVKPIGKTDGNAPWVLPRGTRRAYDSAANEWVDLRSKLEIEELKGAPLERLKRTWQPSRSTSMSAITSFIPSTASAR